MAAQLSGGAGSKSKPEVQAGRWLAPRIAQGEQTVVLWWAGRAQNERMLAEAESQPWCRARIRAFVFKIIRVAE